MRSRYALVKSSYAIKRGRPINLAVHGDAREYPLSHLGIDSMIGDFAIRIGFLAVKKRLAAGKTVFDTVPKTHAGFADLPAQKNHFGAQHAREIDQSLLDAFAHAAITIDLFHPTLDLANQSCDLSVLAQTFH